MSNLEIHQFAYGADNYGVLLHDSESGETACIDVGDADATLRALADHGWSLTHLLITHHHADHTAGLVEVKSQTGCQVWGPELSASSVKGFDHLVKQDSQIAFASRIISVLQTPGHTLDMVNYYVERDALVFTGDTLFSMGCGRLFEGDAEMMLQSLKKLKALPAETWIYCAHEYTATNAQFAQDVDPDNFALRSRAEEVNQLRKQKKPTIPVLLSQELATNPFLRTDNPELRSALGMVDDSEVAVLASLREKRNQY